MQNVPLLSQRGFSLLELSIVVVLLGMAAVIAMPSVSTSEDYRLALAQSDVADAVRFARDEARRTGVVHGVSASNTNNRVRVFRLDESQNPNARIFDVYHPVWKQIYTVELDAEPYRGVVLTAVAGQLTGACNDPTNVVFDSAGVTRCFEPVTTRIGNASISLNLGDFERTVAIGSYTGRVTSQ